jgi:transcriptional regulator with XRE-family HTH domain
MAEAPGSPTVRRRELGKELRRLREAAGLTIERASEMTGKAASHVSRIERAEAGASVATVEKLLTAYAVAPGVRTHLLQVAREAGQRGWWQHARYREAVMGPYATLIGFESAATSIKTFEPTLMPGLLQTEEYARASLQRGPARLLGDEIEARVEVRRQRQAILDRPDPPEFWAVLDEAVIRRPVGGPDVMRRQLLHAVEMASRPNIEVHVIPFRVGGHPGVLGPFVVMSFPAGQTDLVYIESMAGDLYPEHRLSWYADVFERLSADAVGLADSVKIMREAAEGLT